MNIFKKNRFNNDCKRLMFYIVAALLFMLPFSYEISSLLLVVGWLVYIYKSVKGFFEWERTPFDFPIAIFVVISFLSIFVSPDPAFSFYNCYNLVGRYVLTYYLVVQSLNIKDVKQVKVSSDTDKHVVRVALLEQVKTLLYVMCFSLAIVIVYGFLQAFFGIGLTSEEAMVWTDNAIFPGLKTRVFSTWQNPNLLGGYLDFMLGMLMGIFVVVKNRNLRIAIGILFCITAFCLTLTYARGACLSIAVVMAVYGALYNRKILVALIALAVILLVSDAALVERLTSVFSKLDTSSEMRLAFWESTIAMILDHPLLGIGWGAYFMVYPSYDYYMQGDFIKIVHAHNMYLNFMAEIGLFGFVSYMVYFFGIIYKAFKTQISDIEPLNKGVMLGIGLGMSALALNGLTDYVMFNTELSMLVWLFSGVAVILGKKVYK
ncbi:O-antigen ligase RfaL [Megamonas hypermegale]|uniref:O-antigen ligase RfaL n=1 Tax=Megamonas hypermegale TaxID=158847 RepID=A0A239TSQ6_9FIRM|nr:O-antigen ligase family protein [Megamonas hypermegale]SNV00168.1 O-antigen ligase RfaL [Megamonas hypermegale]